MNPFVKTDFVPHTERATELLNKAIAIHESDAEACREAAAPLIEEASHEIKMALEAVHWPERAEYRSIF